MIVEKMLEYLMLKEIMKLHGNNVMRVCDKLNNDEHFDIMETRFLQLEDEFIHEYKPTRPIIKNPVKDITATEE